jgi:hypothetical protein
MIPKVSIPVSILLVLELESESADGINSRIDSTYRHSLVEYRLG